MRHHRRTGHTRFPCHLARARRECEVAVGIDTQGITSRRVDTSRTIVRVLRSIFSARAADRRMWEVIKAILTTSTSNSIRSSRTSIDHRGLTAGIPAAIRTIDGTATMGFLRETEAAGGMWMIMFLLDPRRDSAKTVFAADSTRRAEESMRTMAENLPESWTGLTTSRGKQCKKRLPTAPSTTISVRALALAIGTDVDIEATPVRVMTSTTKEVSRLPTRRQRVAGQEVVAAAVAIPSPPT